jgi:hypothetical protein
MQIMFGGTTPRVDTWDNDTHLIIFRYSEWNHQPEAMNMVSTSHGMDGVISDSDIEINCVDHNCTADHVEWILTRSLASALSVRDIGHLCRKYPAGEESPCRWLHEG